MKSNEDIISLTPNTSYQDVSDARKSEKFETDTPEIENGELSLSERPLEEALGAEPPPPAGPDPNAYPDGGFEAWFCIAGGFGAVFSSFGWVNSIAAAGTWFKRHRALAFGIMVSGSSLGGVVLPIMVQRLIVQLGFGWSIRITGFLILGLLVFANIAVKSRLPPAPKPFTLKEYFVPFLETPFLLLAVGSFFVYVGAFLPFNFIIVEAKEAGTPTNITDYLVPIINAASIFGRIFPAHLGDVYGVFNVCIIFTLFSGVISLALWLPAASSAPIIVFAVLYGFASGLTLAIIPALVASISDIQKLGHRVGTLYAFSAFGTLFGR
ncbi:putative monocarboxylate permease-like protein [Eutypa lata UCREL1]|uniref:Putative monocarboxylate permease-like protein n=1 Tax=Eutypa lata (strain UCR-EL1) TaxID=1287681 RepID=M7SMH2_EUTLA|nr:putative monocarboxylate permease-like protein [Eutypa lata UCREL1]